MSEETNQLKTYIEQARAGGASDEGIRQALANTGWSDEDVSAALSTEGVVGGGKEPAQISHGGGFLKKLTSFPKAVRIGVAIALVIVGGAVLAYSTLIIKSPEALAREAFENFFSLESYHVVSNVHISMRSDGAEDATTFNDSLRGIRRFPLAAFAFGAAADRLFFDPALRLAQSEMTTPVEPTMDGFEFSFSGRTESDVALPSGLLRGPFGLFEETSSVFGEQDTTVDFSFDISSPLFSGRLGIGGDIRAPNQEELFFRLRDFSLQGTEQEESGLSPFGPFGSASLSLSPPEGEVADWVRVELAEFEERYAEEIETSTTPQISEEDRVALTERFLGAVIFERTGSAKADGVSVHVITITADPEGMKAFLREAARLSAEYGGKNFTEEDYFTESLSESLGRISGTVHVGKRDGIIRNFTFRVPLILDGETRGELTIESAYSAINEPVSIVPPDEFISLEEFVGSFGFGSLIGESFLDAQVQGRNANRISDLQMLSLALELYYDQHNAVYPDTGGVLFHAAQMPCPELMQDGLITDCPSDPSGPPAFYGYKSIGIVPGNAVSYELTGVLEDPTCTYGSDFGKPPERDGDLCIYRIRQGPDFD